MVVVVVYNYLLASEVYYSKSI